MTRGKVVQPRRSPKANISVRPTARHNDDNGVLPPQRLAFFGNQLKQRLVRVGKLGDALGHQHVL